MPGVETATVVDEVVQRELRATGAAASLRVLLDAAREGTIRLVEDENLVDDAFLLALELGHKLPDCIYLGLTEREGCAARAASQRARRGCRGRMSSPPQTSYSIFHGRGACASWPARSPLS